jgi:hypothetical protein
MYMRNNTKYNYLEGIQTSLPHFVGSWHKWPSSPQPNWTKRCLLRGYAEDSMSMYS